MCIFILPMCPQVHLCLFMYVCVCVHESLCNRRPTVRLSKLFQLWSQSSVSVNQDRTSGPVLSHNYVPLLHPPFYNSSETRAQAFNTCFFMYWLSCQCWSYGPTYIVKYSVNLHHLKHLAVVLLSLLCCNYTVSNLSYHCHFLNNVCYSFANSFQRPCHALCYS